MTYDNITHASDERLAEMLEGIITVGKFTDASEVEVIINEAARRLRRPKNCPFNSEQFE